MQEDREKRSSLLFFPRELLDDRDSNLSPTYSSRPGITIALNSESFNTIEIGKVFLCEGKEVCLLLEYEYQLRLWNCTVAYLL